jgi:hypothetical protein
MYSTNGTDWTAAAIPDESSAPSYDWEKVVYGGGKFVASGYIGSTPKVAYSTDGITWTLATNLPSGVTKFQVVAYGNNKFIAIDADISTYSSNIYSSTDDLSSWETSKFSGIYDVTFGGDRFVAVGFLEKIYASSDGSTWKESTNDWIQNGGFTVVAYGDYTIPTP